jgi:uncharacterized protein (DUF2147 family)
MKRKLVAILFILLSLSRLNAQEMDRLLGKWMNEDKTQIIEVVRKNNTYMGKLVFIDVPNSKLILDTENDDESLRKRRVLGSLVWKEFEYQEDKDMWKYGSIYNYKSGNTYNGKIHVEEDQLNLTGFYGFLFFLAKTQNWSRVIK